MTIMTDDYRRQKRRKSEQLIKVIDTLTLKQLGLVADLSESGMMLISSSPIEPDGLFQCELNFPRHVAILGTISVGVQELWSESDTRNGQHIVGFRFIDISREDRMQIRDWVNEPGSNYA
jgi:c-di-GMP-binding flagellar brake protein YcgR